MREAYHRAGDSSIQAKRARSHRGPSQHDRHALQLFVKWPRTPRHHSVCIYATQASQGSARMDVQIAQDCADHAPGGTRTPLLALDSRALMRHTPDSAARPMNGRYTSHHPQRPEVATLLAVSSARPFLARRRRWNQTQAATIARRFRLSAKLTLDRVGRFLQADVVVRVSLCSLRALIRDCPFKLSIGH